MVSSSPPIEAPAREAEPLAGNYFVGVYPPFSAWQPSQIHHFKDALQKPSPPTPLGIYVHLPFCQKKCDYCYYLSYVGKSAETINGYLRRLIQELELYAAQPALKYRDVSFVYFGGGTPSLLTAIQLRALANGLQRVFSWNHVEEVTYECAPRSVRVDFLRTLREIGVTRLSMGVQSFDNSILKLNGRVHLADDVSRAYERIRATGFDWVNLDLMCGLIGETPEQWRKSIGRVLELSPESVTMYQTEIPHNTQLYRDWKSGALPAAPVSWEIKRVRLHYAFSMLERAGYTVVSAYNAVKNPARHHFKYQDHLWHGADMLGLGVASFGYLDGVHFQNHSSLEEYEASIDVDELPLRRAFRLSEWDQLVREFVLQLKLGEVNVATFENKFGVDVTRVFAVPLKELSERGFLLCSHLGVRLSRAGLLRVDRLLPRFYDTAYRDVRYT